MSLRRLGLVWLVVCASACGDDDGGGGSGGPPPGRPSAFVGIYSGHIVVALQRPDGPWTKRDNFSIELVAGPNGTVQSTGADCPDIFDVLDATTLKLRPSACTVVTDEGCDFTIIADSGTCTLEAGRLACTYLGTYELACPDGHFESGDMQADWTGDKR